MNDFDILQTLPKNVEDSSCTTNTKCFTLWVLQILSLNLLQQNDFVYTQQGHLLGRKRSYNLLSGPSIASFYFIFGLFFQF